MERPECPGCSARDARIADLERRLSELEARLKTNAANSSTPPSANPLGADAPVTKKKSKRRRGGQPGHPPHLKQLLPPDRVTRTESIVPAVCSGCRAPLAPAHAEAIAAVRQADVKFADETSWKLWGQLCWLWAAATAGVAAFVIHAKRGAAGLAAILGEDIGGIVHSDRWHVYLQVPEER